jgi:hypothetical protein
MPPRYLPAAETWGHLLALHACKAPRGGLAIWPLRNLRINLTCQPARVKKFI